MLQVVLIGALGAGGSGWARRQPTLLEKTLRQRCLTPVLLDAAANLTVLAARANTLRDATRTSDRVYCLGGEEFAVLLYGGSLDDAWQVAERVRQAVETTLAGGAQLPAEQVTVSGGLARGVAADTHLHTAKEAGRYRIHGGRSAPLRLRPSLPGTEGLRLSCADGVHASGGHVRACRPAPQDRLPERPLPRLPGGRGGPLEAAPEGTGAGAWLAA